MTSQDNLLARVEKLERQNRRMKLGGLGALVIAGAFLLMGQASGPRTQDEVRANGFVLVDTSGETRARLFMSSDGPELALYYANGKMGAWLTAGELLNGTALDMIDASGKAGVALTAFPKGPLLNVMDAQGFETSIGATDLVTMATGETHRTSAASVVLFGKDKTVLWSAPRQDGN